MQKMQCLPLFYVLSLLTACGGGSDSSSSSNSSSGGNTPPPIAANASGIYTGSTDLGDYTEGLIQSNGKYWFLYGDDTSARGFIQGTLSTTANTAKSTNGKDFNFDTDTVVPVSIDATVNEEKSFNGSVRYNASNIVSFQTVYAPVPSARLASADQIQGTYFGDAGVIGGVEPANVTFTANTGSANTVSFMGTGSGGCEVSGVLTLSSNKSYFDVEAKTNGYPCLVTNQSLNGVAVYDPSDSSIRLATVTDDRNQALLFIGSKSLL